MKLASHHKYLPRESEIVKRSSRSIMAEAYIDSVVSMFACFIFKK